MYNQRAKVFMALAGLGLAVLAARLVQLQVFDSQASRERIERGLVGSSFLPASRGQILDRHDRILALDEPCFDLCMDFGLLNRDEAWAKRQRRAIRRQLAQQHRDQDLTPEELDELADQELTSRTQAAWDLAGEVAVAQDQDLEAACARVRSQVLAIRAIVGQRVQEETWAHPVVTGLDDSAAVAAKSRLDQTVGLSVEPSRRRLYPYRDVACHIIGLTGPLTAEELAKVNAPPADADPDVQLRQRYRDVDRIGKSGVEKLAEDVLRARWGYRQFNIRSQEVTESVVPQDGGDVRLSIDIELQSQLMKLFPPGQTGCIVVLDVATNQVLAMVSLPSFDLNRFGRDYGLLVGDRVYTPLRHRAVSALYPPGSTAKVIAALGALTEGAVYPGTRFTCNGYLIPGDPAQFRCWIFGEAGVGHGELDLVAAIANSCNVYFYHVGEALGPRRVSDWLRRFGYADLPGTGLPEERSGKVQTPSGAEAVGGSRLEAIGQGPVAVTPLHVANAMAAIARGELMPVNLLLDAPPRPGTGLGVAAMHLDMVRQGMRNVCNQGGATAYKRFHGPGIEELGFEVAGKTGTAAVPPQRIDSDGDGRITDADQIVREGDMAWFAGFAPCGNPQVAVAVVMDYVQGGGGAKDAAPIARETLRLCRQMGYIH
jgi:penicillin-binding protein 2